MRVVDELRVTSGGVYHGDIRDITLLTHTAVGEERNMAILSKSKVGVVGNEVMDAPLTSAWYKGTEFVNFNDKFEVVSRDSDDVYVSLRVNNHGVLVVAGPNIAKYQYGGSGAVSISKWNAIDATLRKNLKKIADFVNAHKDELKDTRKKKTVAKAKAKTKAKTTYTKAAASSTEKRLDNLESEISNISASLKKIIEFIG